MRHLLISFKPVKKIIIFYFSLGCWEMHSITNLKTPNTARKQLFVTEFHQCLFLGFIIRSDDEIVLFECKCFTCCWKYQNRYMFPYNIWRVPSISPRCHHQILTWWQWDHLRTIYFWTKKEFWKSAGNWRSNRWTYIQKKKKNIQTAEHSTSSFLEVGKNKCHFYLLFYNSRMGSRIQTKFLGFVRTI